MVHNYWLVCLNNGLLWGIGHWLLGFDVGDSMRPNIPSWPAARKASAEASYLGAQGIF